MSIVPLTWHSKKDLQRMETSLKLELHSIMKAQGSDSDTFWSKHDELVNVQSALYGKPKHISIKLQTP